MSSPAKAINDDANCDHPPSILCQAVMSLSDNVWTLVEQTSVALFSVDFLHFIHKLIEECYFRITKIPLSFKPSLWRSGNWQLNK